MSQQSRARWVPLGVRSLLVKIPVELHTATPSKSRVPAEVRDGFYAFVPLGMGMTERRLSVLRPFSLPPSRQSSFTLQLVNG